MSGSTTRRAALAAALLLAAAPAGARGTAPIGALADQVGPAISGTTTLTEASANLTIPVTGSGYVITLPVPSATVLGPTTGLSFVVAPGAGPVDLCVAAGAVFDTASAAPLAGGICASGNGIVLSGGMTARLRTESTLNYFATLEGGSPCSSSAPGLCQPDGVTIGASALGVISGQLPVSSTVLSATTTITGSNWTSYAGHLTKVACPAAGCTVTLPQSTSTVAPPNTAFVFQSIGPGIMTLGATTSLLEGVPLTAAGGAYVDRGNQETDYVESDSGNNYLVSPSLDPNPRCMPYALLASPTNKAFSLNFSGWSATGGALTTASQYSPDCGENAATFVEDGSTGHHWISWEDVFSVLNTTQYTASIFCRSLTSDRNCEFETEKSSFSAYADLIVNPITGAIVSGPGGSASAVVTSYGPGLVKISLTWTTSATDTGVWLFAGSSSGSTDSYAGNGSAAISLYGVCLAQGATC